MIFNHTVNCSLHFHGQIEFFYHFFWMIDKLSFERCNYPFCSNYSTFFVGILEQTTMASWLMRLPSKSKSVHFILGSILNYFYFNYRFHVPVVMYVLLSLHNLLLVVNSSVNFIIYCCVGKRFRQELKLMLTPYCNFVCHCICNDQKDQADAEDPVPCQF